MGNLSMSDFGEFKDDGLEDSMSMTDAVQGFGEEELAYSDTRSDGEYAPLEPPSAFSIAEQGLKALVAPALAKVSRLVRENDDDDDDISGVVNTLRRMQSDGHNSASMSSQQFVGSFWIQSERLVLS
jgi:hypothetical protein